MGIMDNKKGTSLMVGLLIFVMTIAVLSALVSPLKTILEIPRQSDGLNCAGFDYDHNGVIGNNILDYNSTQATDTIACVGVDLAIPFLFISIIIGGIAALIYGRNENPSMLDPGM